MCGIAFVRGAAGGEGIVGEMLERLAHRGPDGEGRRPDRAGGVLGHKRLAIIDPQGGAQPLATADGAAALIANGMIYNDADLRADLAAGTPAPTFRTGSDSEPILHGCRAHGPDFVRRLDGMFAFVMSDGGRVLAARDPIGIKPLYIGRRDDALYLASEIKALTGRVDTLSEFPPGHVFDDRIGIGDNSGGDDGGDDLGAGLTPYYAVPAPTAALADPAAAATHLRETLERAVVKRLRSDVPLGAFLSGGLDSSIIAALAKRHLDRLHTFAVGLEGSDDLAAARHVARHIGATHHEYVIPADELLRALPEILYHLESFDADLVRSAAPTWFVAREAAQRVKVVLTGEGADELFAGYAYHKDYADGARLGRELRRSITAMHNINLQRVDRMTMAHGLEARVPYLDLEMIDLAMRIDPALKLRAAADGGDGIEKWILRRAFADLLPDDIVWRRKAQFDQGSGTDRLLAAAAPTGPAAAGAAAETVWYRDMFMDVFPAAAQALPLVARWASKRV